jgi:patatin-like phospholipase/acyl hydrolase
MHHNFYESSINRALIFQGRGSLGAYEAGSYKAIHVAFSRYFRAEEREKEAIFHIVSGTSIGAINAAILVSYVKENKTCGHSCADKYGSIVTKRCSIQATEHHRSDDRRYRRTYRITIKIL